jgi:hypothetical protein
MYTQPRELGTVDKERPRGSSSSASSSLVDADKKKALKREVEDIIESSDELRAWLTEQTLERFLRADKGDLKKACERLSETLRWRRDDMRSYCKTCFSDDSRAHYMHVCGKTMNGRPVVLSDIGLARDTRPSSNVDHATFCMEMVEKCLIEQKLVFPNDTYVWLTDFHKFGHKHLNPSVAKKVLGLFGKHYPERLGNMIFIEAPKIFNILYNICKKFVDPTTIAKLRFVQGPTGLGGGEPFDSLLKEGFLDEDTFEWVRNEMLENRTHWSKASDLKSWTKSHAKNNGRYFFTSSNGGSSATSSHDMRGSEIFLKSKFCVDMHEYCKKNCDMTRCLPIDTRPAINSLVDEEDVENLIFERGDSVSSLMMSPSKILAKDVGDEEDDTDIYHDCKEKFQRKSVAKSIIKKLSPSKRRLQSHHH